MFSKKPKPQSRLAQSRPAGSSPVTAGSTFSILGSDIAVKGDILAAADLHIDGRVEGDIACKAIVQGESSEVVGNIRAESARLAGVVRGSISVRDLAILRTARITGDVHYDTLTIEEGAKVEGRFATRGIETLELSDQVASALPVMTLAR